MYIVAVAVEVATTFGVLNPRALAGLERVQAGRGERLMQEISCILIEQALCFHGDISCGPGPALRRKIQVAFGSEAVEVLDWRGRIVHPQQSVRRIFNCLLANESIVKYPAD